MKAWKHYMLRRRGIHSAQVWAPICFSIPSSHILHEPYPLYVHVLYSLHTTPHYAPLCTSSLTTSPGPHTRISWEPLTWIKSEWKEFYLIPNCHCVFVVVMTDQDVYLKYHISKYNFLFVPRPASLLIHGLYEVIKKSLSGRVFFLKDRRNG